MAIFQDFYPQVLPATAQAQIPTVTFQRNPIGLAGVGWLAGTLPKGLTTVDGTPVFATVRVIQRLAPGELGDGAVVAEVQSTSAGTWRVDGLNPSLKYDVVGRKAGFNDVIMANVSPKVG